MRRKGSEHNAGFAVLFDTTHLPDAVHIDDHAGRTRGRAAQLKQQIRTARQEPDIREVPGGKGTCLRSSFST
jgi:hypothetical protein